MVDYAAILLPKEDLDPTPSQRDGVDAATEKNLRSYGCALVQQAGVYLRLKGVTVASADILLHRFYFRRSLREFDIRFVAAAALYLACKLQEDGRRVGDIIHVFTFIHWKENKTASAETEPPATLSSDSDEFKQIRSIIHRVERYILRETGFMASQSLCLPHPHILKFVDQLFCKLDGIDPNAVAQSAWGYINDSYRSTLCCEVEPRVVAAASISMAAADLDVPLSKDTRWYELFGVSWEAMTEVTDRIKSIYDEPEPYYVKLVKSSKDDEQQPGSKDSNGRDGGDINSKEDHNSNDHKDNNNKKTLDNNSKAPAVDRSNNRGKRCRDSGSPNSTQTTNEDCSSKTHLYHDTATNNIPHSSSSPKRSCTRSPQSDAAVQSNTGPTAAHSSSGSVGGAGAVGSSTDRECQIETRRAVRKHNSTQLADGPLRSSERDDAPTDCLS